MAFSVSVHKDIGLIFTQYSGCVDLIQLQQALSAALEHSDYRPGMVELTDVSSVTETDLDFAKMLVHKSRMAAYYGAQKETINHYIVASEDLGFGMARMYQSLAEDTVPNMNLHLFRTEQEALLAMGREETSIAELLGQST